MSLSLFHDVFMAWWSGLFGGTPLKLYIWACDTQHKIAATFSGAKNVGEDCTYVLRFRSMSFALYENHTARLSDCFEVLFILPMSLPL